MKRVFRFDRQRNALLLQMAIMFFVAAISFYGFRQNNNVFLLLIIFIAFAFIFVYIYRIFLTHIVFEKNSVTYKSLFHKIHFSKSEIQCIYILKLNKKRIEKLKYSPEVSIQDTGQKKYVAIVKQEKENETYQFSTFSIANENRIILEYVPGVEKYLNQLLP